MRTQGHNTALIFQSALALLLVSVVYGKLLPPAKIDGFVYGHRRSFEVDSILIEAFYDPVCPDSRDSWPALKQALSFYGDRLHFILHLLPLPYHDNSYATSRALHIVNNLNSTATFQLLESIFKSQKIFYNAQTRELSKADVEIKIVKFASNFDGNSYYNALESGFSDPMTDRQTRVSFKYSASRGVFSTPFFFVNGFKVDDTESSLDFNGWQSIINPLLGKNHPGMFAENMHFFL